MDHLLGLFRHAGGTDNAERELQLVEVGAGIFHQAQRAIEKAGIGPVSQRRIGQRQIIGIKRIIDVQRVGADSRRRRRRG